MQKGALLRLARARPTGGRGAAAVAERPSPGGASLAGGLPGDTCDQVMLGIMWLGLGEFRPATEAQERRPVGCRPELLGHPWTEFLEPTGAMGAPAST
jgi:hypothetical protein